MSDEPTRGQFIRQKVREGLPSVVGYGLGYGIARTALESGRFGPLSPDTRRYVPIVLGALAAYAGAKADTAYAREQEAKKR